MTNLIKLHGIVNGRTIELLEDLHLPEGTKITLDIAVPATVQSDRRLPPELEGVCGALADLGEEVDEFNHWYRDARHSDVAREIESE